MPEKLQKINSWASAINGWGKIIIGLIVFIISVGTAWYQIETNAADNVRQDENIKSIIGNQQKQFNQMMDNVNREFEIQANRSDKRYQRAMQEAQELHAHDHEIDDKITEITKELWYLKGKLDKQDKNK